MAENKTRYHLSKHYVYNPLPFGDVQLLQLGRRYCDATEVIAAHPHLNWFELTIVTSGSGTIITNGEETPVCSGDIYLSFPCDIHEIRADRGDKLEYDFFSFYPTDKELSKAFKTITLEYWDEKKRVFQNEKISALVEQAISEFIPNEKPDSKAVLTDIFHLILVYLIRNFRGVQAGNANVSQAEILCFQVMNYIDTHVYSLKNLESLALKFNYNYGYLSGLFKRTTGKTIFEYYYHRKMETAKALLLERKKTVGEIAKMLGYNLYSFSKAFKKKHGISPKAMQKQKV